MIFFSQPRACLLLWLGFSCHVLGDSSGSQFDVQGGQVFTPGLAIVDSPQPNTPEGGDTLQVALDISGDGRIPQVACTADVESCISNITVFLTSYTTGLNLTISNGTSAGWVQGTTEDPVFACPLDTAQGGASSAAVDPSDAAQGSPNAAFAAKHHSDNAKGKAKGKAKAKPAELAAAQAVQTNAGCLPIMSQEPGSTVKHVNWVWPDCLVGNGASTSACGNGGNVQDCLTPGAARGEYNISIHQSFRLNSQTYYTIFNLPIQVTNSIPNSTTPSPLTADSGTRPLCALRNNPLQSLAQQNSSVTTLPFQPYLGGSVEEGGSSGSGSGSGSGSNGSGSGSGSGNGNGNGNGNNGGSPNDSGSAASTGGISTPSGQVAGLAGPSASLASASPTTLSQPTGGLLKDLKPSAAGALGVRWLGLFLGMGVALFAMW